jgi:hypothetical protein
MLLLIISKKSLFVVILSTLASSTCTCTCTCSSLHHSIINIEYRFFLAHHHDFIECIIISMMQSEQKMVLKGLQPLRLKEQKVSLIF